MVISGLAAAVAGLVFVVASPPAAQFPNPAQAPPKVEGAAPRPCEPKGPVVQIPSKAAGPDGLTVRVSSPERARYTKGAPVAVLNPGLSIDRVAICLRDFGFVDVHFQCPNLRMDASERTVACREALADVLAFATGQLRSVENKSIGEYTADITPLTGNVGVIGWSAGGNNVILTMAQHGARFPALKWFASWESPVLSPLDGGWGASYQPNPFYDPASGSVDFTRLRYSPEMPMWVWPPQRLTPEPNWPHGGLYLDGDRNGIFNKDADYGFWVNYFSTEAGLQRKAFYERGVIREARDRKVFGAAWPAHIATVEEVEARASREDPLRYIPAAVRRFPSLAVVVFQSEVGHISSAAEHPIAHVNGWLDAGAHWVRFNPDARYVERAMGKKPSREVQHPAGKRLERRLIRALLEPEAENGGPTDIQGMTAAACELADRTYSKDWAPVLTRVLVQ